MISPDNAKMPEYEVGGCGYECIDSLNCPYEVCIHDDPRIARMSINAYSGCDIESLTGRQRAEYIRALHHRGLMIEDIIKMTGIPYKKVWTTLSVKTQKGNSKA